MNGLQMLTDMRNNTNNKSRVSVTLGVILGVLLLSFLLVYDSYVSNFPKSELNSVAMGTAVNVTVYGADKEACNEIMREISLLESIISRNIEGSAADKLNKRAIVIDAELAKLAEICNKNALLTDGCFDVTIGAVTSLWGIGTENARVPDEAELAQALETVDHTALTVTGNTVSCKSGQNCDFGAVGKGYACDKAYELLSQGGNNGAVVSVGGSILVCGVRNPKGSPWKVAVRNPANEGYLGTLSLNAVRPWFISTSGDYERTLEIDGKVYHHIIDSNTGYSAESGLTSVTVLCDNGADADALSTACFVAGLEKGTEIIKKADASFCEAIFVDKIGNVYITEGLRDIFSLEAEGYMLNYLT